MSSIRAKTTKANQAIEAWGDGKKIITKEETAQIRKEKAKAREEKIAKDMLANPIKYYKRDLKRLSWCDDDASFYEWLAVQAKHECAPNHSYLKDFHGIWTGVTPGYVNMMNADEFDEQKRFYIKLAQYKLLL